MHRIHVSALHGMISVSHGMISVSHGMISVSHGMISVLHGSVWHGMIIHYSQQGEDRAATSQENGQKPPGRTEQEGASGTD